MIYDLQPFKSEYTPVSSRGMAATEQRDGLIGARRSDGCITTTRQGDIKDEGKRPQFDVYGIRVEAGPITTALVQIGWVIGRDPTVGGDAIGAPILPTYGGINPMATTRVTIEVGKTLYCRVVTTEDDLPVSATIVSEPPRPASTHAQPEKHNIDGVVTSGNESVPGIYYYPIADFEVGASGRLVVANQYQSGGPIRHDPGRTGHSSSLRLVDCGGGAALAFLNFHQGIQTTDLGDQEVEAGCDGGTTSSPP